MVGDVGEQLAQRRATARQPEGRLEVPAGEEHRIARAGDVFLQPAERVLSVDEQVDRIPVARRRIAGTPQPVARRVVGVLPAAPLQASPVMGDDELFDSGTD